MTEIEAFIKSASAGGGTDINAALVRADTLLKNSNAQVKSIVLMTDGMPQDNGAATLSTGRYSIADIDQTVQVAPCGYVFCAYTEYTYKFANAAYATASSMKPKYNIYTIGYFQQFENFYDINYKDFAIRFLNDIQNKGYYDAADVDSIEFELGEIAKDIMGDDDTPVIFIPGIMGSTLYANPDCTDPVWDVEGEFVLTKLLSFHVDGERLNIHDPVFVKNYTNCEEGAPINQAENYEGVGSREYGVGEFAKDLIDELSGPQEKIKGPYKIKQYEHGITVIEGVDGADSAYTISSERFYNNLYKILKDQDHISSTQPSPYVLLQYDLDVEGNALIEKYLGSKFSKVYFFSYDFRKSTIDAAQKLYEFINKVSPDGKVNIIAHSQGGLVVSQYVKNFSDNSKEKINSVITIAVPFEGSLKPFNAMLNKEIQGKDNTIPNLGDLLTFIGRGHDILNRERLSAFPGFAELTQTEQLFNYYIKDTNYSFFGAYDDFMNKEYHGTAGIPSWPKIETFTTFSKVGDILFNRFSNESIDITRFYDNSIDFDNSEIGVQGAKSNIKNAENINLLTDLPNSYFIIGVDQKTLSGGTFRGRTEDIQYLNMHLDYDDVVHKDTTIDEVKFKDLTYDNIGDGTVPWASATMSGKLYNKVGAPRYKEIPDGHTAIVNNPETIKSVLKVLNGGTLIDEEVAGPMPIKKGYIVIRIACPVDVEISLNGETLNSNVDNYSARASFGRMDLIGRDGDIKMFAIDDDDYSITITGTGEGTMDYTIRYFDENGVLVEERNITDVPITPKTLISTDTRKNADTTLSVDSNGDGIADDYYTWRRLPTDSFISAEIDSPALLSESVRVRSNNGGQSTVVGSLSADGSGNVFSGSFEIPQNADMEVTATYAGGIMRHLPEDSIQKDTGNGNNPAPTYRITRNLQRRQCRLPKPAHVQ